MGALTSAPSGLSSAYQSLFTSCITNASIATFTLTIIGLTPGNHYEFEWWTLILDLGGAPTTATAGNSVSLTGNPGQFATGTFTATTTSQVITFGPADGTIPALTAVQLRDLGHVSAVPAPPTVVLVGLGAGCVALRRYVGRRATA